MQTADVSMSSPTCSNTNVSCCYLTLGGVNFIVGGGMDGGKKSFRLPKLNVVSISINLNFFLVATIQEPKSFSSFGMLSL